MTFPVLIQPVSGNGYRASVLPPEWSAEGTTADDALSALSRRVASDVAAGARIGTIDIPGGEHPFAVMVGSLKGHPLLDEWKEAVAEYRHGADADPDRF
jgi:hypothetical protein